MNREKGERRKTEEHLKSGFPIKEVRACCLGRKRVEGEPDVKRLDGHAQQGTGHRHVVLARRNFLKTHDL